jgi:citrate lyase subunit beta / citryl-CoA lyase
VSSAEHPLHRSYLYAPGSAPRVLRKALAAGPDAVVFDLEDAVAPDAKDDARREVVRVLDEVAAGEAGARPDVHVRINRDADGYHAGDLQAVVRPALDALRLPKAESAEMVAALAEQVSALEVERGLPPGRIGLYLVVESALGAVRLADLATADRRVQRLVIGGQDLLADIGAEGDDELATLHVRSEMVLHSRAAGIGPPIDGVFPSLDDEDGLRASSLRGRSLGFFGRSVLHPRQLAVVHDVFTPSDEDLAYARRLVSALEAAETSGSGALQVDGEFVDLAIARRAQALLARRRSA